jgi:hypothetical protein
MIYSTEAYPDMEQLLLAAVSRGETTRFRYVYHLLDFGYDSIAALLYYNRGRLSRNSLYY